MPNPLNANVCIGQGLSVDALGRPRWTKDVVGQWFVGERLGQGYIGTADYGVQNMIAPILNATTQDRACAVTFWSSWVDILSYPSATYPGPDAGPFVRWRWGIGPGLGSGNADLAMAAMDGFPSVPVRLRWPGPMPTNFVIIPAGQTYNACLTVDTQGQRTSSLWDVLLGPMTITAHWLGG